MALLSVTPWGHTKTAAGVGRDYGRDIKAILSLSVPAGAGVLPFPDRLDGIEQVALPDPLLASRTAYSAAIHLGNAGDVADTIHDIVLTITNVSPEAHRGIASLNLVEIPLATLRPESGEHGVLETIIDPREIIHDGSADRGTRAFLLAERSARTRVREHWQVSTYEDIADCWTRASSTFGAINWGSSLEPRWRMRLRAVYGASAAFTLRVRYRSSDSGDLRLQATPVGGAPLLYSLALPSSSSAWTSAQTTVSLPTSGTEQQIDLEFEARINSGTLYLSSIALVQSEVP